MPEKVGDMGISGGGDRMFVFKVEPGRTSWMHHPEILYTLARDGHFADLDTTIAEWKKWAAQYGVDWDGETLTIHGKEVADAGPVV